MFKGAAKKATVNDMCGPSVLRSTLVSGGRGHAEDEFDDAELLGQGAYGMVHKVQDKVTGQSKVLKSVVRPDGWDDERLKMEAKILQNLDHPHILRIFSWYEEGDCINIVMEHCDGGELLKVVREGRRQGEALPEPWAATSIRQCFQALVYIHSKGVVHKDLKGQNLLLLHDTKENSKVFGRLPHIVICDLGIAEICSRGIFGLRGSKVAGTPATMAPEVWSGSCGPKSDVWSMGCVMFEMFTNKLPFEVRGNVEGAAKQQAKWVELHSKGPNWDLLRCSAEAKALCKTLLTFRESARPSAQECLQNNWLKVPEAEEMTQQEMEKLCSAVLTWRDRSACQRAFCLKVAANCTCIDKFAKIFVKFDTDHSGILDTPEMVSALMSVGISKDLAKKTAKALDVNGDNSCEYLEFTAACLLSMEEEFDELLRQEFRILDAKRSGNLSPKEMEQLMLELKALAASRGFTIEEIDADGDGQVDFQEFCSYFGRPNVSYSRALPRKDGPNGLSKMPMKQHVRIMGGQGKSIETSMEAIRKSMPAGKNDAAPLSSIKKGEIEPTGDESIGKKAQSAPELPEGKKVTVQETEKSKKKAPPTTKKSDSALPSSAPTSAGESKRRISSSSSAASSASAAGYAPKASDGKADAAAQPDGPDKTAKSAGQVQQADLAAAPQVPDADSAARPDLAAAVLADTPPAEPNAAKNVDMGSEPGSDVRSLQGNPDSGNIPSPMSQDGTTVRISMSDSSLQEQIPPPCGCLSSSTKSKSPVSSQAPLQQPARPPLKCGRLTISL